mgnify:FL=1
MTLEHKLLGVIAGATSTGYAIDLYNKIAAADVHVFTGFDTDYMNTFGAFVASSMIAAGAYTGNKIREYVDAKYH